jgi:hypothetical protein
MAAIWMKDESSWSRQPSVPFENEAILHRLIAETPAMLPLSGEPDLVVLGTEVPIGPGRADVVAVERGGRVVIIEVKLARNAEVRRAVVAQILSYAAHLHGLTTEEFEAVLGPRLRLATKCATLVEAVAAEAQEGDFDEERFRTELAACLAGGKFRLVFVVDDAPAELVQLVGYLETMSDGWRIDLIRLSAYRIEGREILVPQRVDPERGEPQPTGSSARTAKFTGALVPGAGDFEAAIDRNPEEQRGLLRMLASWAKSLESAGLVRLESYHGKGRMILLPRFQPDNVGLVTIWNENGGSLQFWRSVFERRAPRALARLLPLLHPFEPGQGNTTKRVTPELLAVLTDAYREARGVDVG